MAEKMTLQDVRDAMRGIPIASFHELEKWADAIDAHLAQPAQAVDVGKRSAKDYAIEHGGYLARSAASLIDAINDHAMAQQQFEEGDGSDDAVESAGQSLSDASDRVRDNIYEFEKRRDRAIGNAQAEG